MTAVKRLISLIPARREVSISRVDLVTAAGLNHDLSKAVIPVLVCGTVTEAVLLMKLIGNLVERALHLLKTLHFDDSSARFFGKSGNPAVGFVSKDVADVAVVTTGPGACSTSMT